MIPAVDDPALVALCSGDMAGGLADTFQVLLNCVASLDAGAGALSVILHYRAAEDVDDDLTRLCLYIRVEARDADTLAALSRSIKNSILSSLYSLELVSPPQINWGGYCASCDVVRAGRMITPTVTNRDNWRVPSVLYEDAPFSPNDHRDFIEIDRLAYTMDEDILTCVCLESYDAVNECEGMVRYPAALSEANRSCDADSRGSGDYATFDGGAIHEARRRLMLPNKREPLADEVARSMLRRRQDMSAPQLLFHCRVLGEKGSTVRQIAATLAECGLSDGACDFVLLHKGEAAFEKALSACMDGRVGLVPSKVAECAAREPRLYEPLLRTPQMACPRELAGFVSLPYGGTTSPYCMRQSTDPTPYREDELIVVGHDCRPGNGGLTTRARGFEKVNACKGVCFVAMPGTGKTVSLMNMAYQFHRDRIPCIIIAPIAGEELRVKFAKENDDAEIRDFARGVRIFTPGRDDVSAMAFNPLSRFPRVSREQHDDGLMECFRGSIPLFPALDCALQEALYRLYRRDPADKTPPRMSDLVNSVFEILDSKGYEGEVASNLRAAAAVRMARLRRGSLARVFDSGIDCPDMDELLSGTTFFELDALHEQERALFILFFLKKLREYLYAEPETTEYLTLQR